MNKVAEDMTLPELYAELKAAAEDRDRQLYQNWIDYRERKGFYARPHQARKGDPWKL